MYHANDRSMYAQSVASVHYPNASMTSGGVTMMYPQATQFNTSQSIRKQQILKQIDKEKRQQNQTRYAST